MASRMAEPNHAKTALAYGGPPSVHNGLLRQNHKPKQNSSVRGKVGAAAINKQPSAGFTSGNRASSFNQAGAGQVKEPTREEKIALKETEDENKRKGLFKRIFPSRDFLYYKQFFEEERPLNHFLDSRLMAKKRENTHAARIQNEKLPHFLQPHYLQMREQQMKESSGPASGTGPSGAPPTIDEGNNMNKGMQMTAQ